MNDHTDSKMGSGKAVSRKKQNILLSQRIANIKDRKKIDDEKQAVAELEEIKGQSIKGLTSQEFKF